MAARRAGRLVAKKAAVRAARWVYLSAANLVARKAAVWVDAMAATTVGDWAVVQQQKILGRV